MDPDSHLAQTASLPLPADDPRSPADTTWRKKTPVRNQNACDACRARKVKCRYNENQIVCRACAELKLPCTFYKPRRRRGPVNRHAESLRAAASLQSPAGSATGPPPEIASPPLPAESAFPYTPRSDASSMGHWLSSFAASEIVRNLLNEWFNRIHPLAPILHRRRLLHRLDQGEADQNKVFCALIVSVCAATVGTLKTVDPRHITVEYCLKFVQQHRLLDHGIVEPIYSVDWCVAMYNLGTAAMTLAGMHDVRGYRIGSETAAAVRYLTYYHMDSMSLLEQEQLKRLFWLLFAWSSSSDCFGRLAISVVLCGEKLNHLVPLPLTDNELDPQIASSSQDLPPWHGDAHTYVPGLKSLSDLFMVWYTSQYMPSPNKSPIELLHEYLSAIQRIIDNLPPELRWRGGLSRPHGVTQGHDAQIANIFITSLHLRSSLLQKYGPTEHDGDEHQRIVDDLLEILYHMPQAVFEANGSSVIPKVRDIGAAYLEQVRIGNNTEIWVSDTAKVKLERLLRKLDDLDFWPAQSLRENGSAGSPSSFV